MIPFFFSKKNKKEGPENNLIFKKNIDKFSACLEI